MDRLRTEVVKCSYKDIDRQLKEQLIHGLHDEEMLVEIIRELTKCDENSAIHSENVLTMAKSRGLKGQDSGNQQLS